MKASYSSLVLFIIFASFFDHPAKTEDHGRELVFTSKAKLMRLERLERELVTAFRQSYSEGSPSDWPSTFPRFIDLVEQEHRASLQHPANSVLNYRLIRRFTSAWPAWRQTLDEFAEGKENQAVRNFLVDCEEVSFEYDALDRLPEEAWLRAANALNILQLMYDIGPSQIDCQAGARPRLSAHELLEVSAANLLHRFDGWSKIVAPFWLHLAMTDAARIHPYSSRALLLAQIRRAHADHPDADPVPNEGWEAVNSSVKRLPALVTSYREFMKKSATEGVELRLCDSPIDLHRPNTSYVCFFFFAGPYMPFKYEIMSEYPYVAVIHDLVPSGKAEEMINHAEPTLSTSNVVGEESGSRAAIGDRLSESGNLKVDSNLHSWFNNRIRYATLLTPDFRPEGKSSGEVTQIINYGIGGYYMAHHDYLHDREDGAEVFEGQWAAESGDRLATVMAYLRAPLSGGNTVFPLLNVSVAPVRGKAIFWFNLNPLNGKVLNETLHTACPVGDGDKWVANKWVREHGNAGRVRPIL